MILRQSKKELSKRINPKMILNHLKLMISTRHKAMIKILMRKKKTQTKMNQNLMKKRSQKIPQRKSP